MKASRTSGKILIVTVIVLLGVVVVAVSLHLFAVGGIYAFNKSLASHKAHEAATPASVKATRNDASSTTDKTYTVKKGDTATSIAHNYGLTAEELLKANHLVDPKRLQPGQTLKVPPRKS